MAESGAGAGRDIPEQAKNQGDKERLKTVKERQHEERQRKLEEIKTQALAAQRFKEQKEMERRRRMEELKGKEDVRRQQVEERKRAIYQAEQERAESILRRNQEREARIEAKRRNERSNIVFAFGSSTPRMLDPTDISTTSFWGTRRATSIQNITSTSNVPLTRRQSERDLDGGSKKRAISAGGLERAGESGSGTAQSPAGCVSGYVGRRRTDLMPTIPSRDSSFSSATQQRKSHNQSPGRAFSMSRLDQLAKPRVLKKTTAEMPAVVETIPATRYPYQTPTTFIRPLSAAPKQTFTRSMSHLNAVGKTAPGAGGHNAQSFSITVSSQAATTKKATLSKTNSRSFHQLSGDGAAAAFVFAHPRPTRATQLRQQRLQASAANANIGDASSRPSSSLSQQSTTSSVSVRHRPSTAPRRPRPASIAITGISQDHHLKSSTYTILTDGQKVSGRKPPVIPPASSNASAAATASSDKAGHLKSSTYTTLVDEKTAKNLPNIPGKQSQSKSAIHSSLTDEKKETKPPLKKTRTFNKEKLTLKDKVVISTSGDGTVQQQIVKSPDTPPSEPVESIENVATVVTAETGAGDAKANPEPQQETTMVEDSVQETAVAAAPAATTTEEAVRTGDQIKLITTELIHSESLGEAPLPQQPVNPPPPVVDVIEPVPATSLENPPIEMETAEIKSSHQDENSAANLEKSENEMTQSFSKIRINTEEEAKAALAERRRLAREEAERQAEQERLRIEMEAQAELERQRMEEEQIQRLIAQQRIAEQERLDEAIREKQRAEEEERLRKEEEQRTKLQKEEAERKAREEAEKKAAEQAERLKNEEKEREARRKRVEAIMRRTRGANNANTPTPQNSEDQNENDQKAEKVNGTQNAEEKNGTDNEKEVDIVDNIIPDDSVKNANTVSSDTTISTDSINSNNTWQATQQYGNTVNNNNNN